MNNVKKMLLIAVIIMAILSFSNLFGLNIAGFSVIVGVVFFFINKAVEKQSDKDSGFDIKSIGADLRDKKIWFWIALPLIMDAVCITIAKLFLPEYIEYLVARTGGFVSLEMGALVVFQLAFLALGEEIAWRAFFQNQLGRALPIMPTLLVTSVLFAIGHFTAGSAVVVVYNLFFIFINSILYGVVFHKTNNAWVSAISHFIANLFSVIVLIFL